MNKAMTRLLIAANADRKKFTVLAILLIVFVGFGVRTLTSGGPRSVKAGARTAEKSSKASKSKQSDSSTGARRTRHGPEIKIPLPPSLTRNLFAFNESYFPDPAQTDSSADSAPKSGTANVEAPSQAPAPKPGDSLEARVGKEAERLRLRGTLLGANPMAVIEAGAGRERSRSVVRPGDEVEGFKLIEVRATEVVIEKDGIRVELKRALPES